MACYLRTLLSVFLFLISRRVASLASLGSNVVVQEPQQL